MIISQLFPMIPQPISLSLQNKLRSLEMGFETTFILMYVQNSYTDIYETKQVYAKTDFKQELYSRRLAHMWYATANATLTAR